MNCGNYRQIETVRFVNRGPTFQASILWVEAPSSEQLTRLKSERAVLVVRSRDLNAFRSLGDAVIDCHRKHPAKGLASILLGKDRIPLLEGTYSDVGQLQRGVRALLTKSFERGEINAYCIGVPDDLFTSLHRSVSTAAQRKPKVARFKSRALTDALFSRVDETRISERLLELLPAIEVPEKLERTYVGNSIEVRVVRSLIMTAAHSSSPVLILGDTGTGKELVARAIHEYSGCTGRFVALNCSGIPAELFESELFGYVKGAHNTAFTDKMGVWEAAQDGTLFLDEIGDLSLPHQAKILRALQEERITRIGATWEIEVNARIVGASHHDLYAMVKARQFREDLYYRLRHLVIRTPTLRRRRDDIPALAQHLWRGITNCDSARLPQEVLRQLQNHNWPGNVREMKSVLGYLNTHFSAAGVTEEKLRLVFLILGHQAPGLSATDKGFEIQSFRAECLRLILRADEVLRACKISVRPILVPRAKARRPEPLGAVREAVQQNLRELELLCLRPLLFHSRETFNAIYKFKGQFAAFYDSGLVSARKARRFWRDHASSSFVSAEAALFREMGRLLRDR